MKKIGIFYAGFNKKGGGVVTHLQNLEKGLSQAGYKVDVWSLDKSLLLGYFVAGIEKIFDRILPPSGKLLRYFATKILFYFQLKKHYLKYDYQIFEDIFSFPQTPMPKKLYFFHGYRADFLDDLKFRIKFFEKMLLNYEINCLKKVKNQTAFVSREHKDLIAKTFNLNLDSAQVIENSADLSLIESVLKNNYQKENTIISVGLLIKRKNPEFILELAKKIKKDDIGFKFKIIGDGPEFAKIKNKIEEHQLKDIVILKGKLGYKETLEELAKSKIFILPSFKESFSFVLLEAKLLGNYTIATEGLAVPDIFVDKFLPLDVNFWIEEIKNPSSKKEINIEEMKRRFSLERQINQIINYFEKNT
ncbi:glycosyl transferase [Carboxydothermus islandicus]|uniref:Glycosyl transferase n=1 Tax=Carboxydothermus islandicus TaxID=661089 RepID=A0A1L8D4Y6_9THEO|nr:glycosyltransferase family 4 protein [Carboxydothermus islandicus]GAV26218.1 glycosyl transferase [Carboxydothermus islandicus]